MAELHVRNLPSELHTRLREQAVSEGRSMSAEAVVLLRRALQGADDQLGKQRAAIDRLGQIRRRARMVPGVSSSEWMVREDRDAAG